MTNNNNMSFQPCDIDAILGAELNRMAKAEGSDLQLSKKIGLSRSKINMLRNHGGFKKLKFEIIINTFPEITMSIPEPSPSFDDFSLENREKNIKLAAEEMLVKELEISLDRIKSMLQRIKQIEN